MEPQEQDWQMLPCPAPGSAQAGAGLGSAGSPAPLKDMMLRESPACFLSSRTDRECGHRCDPSINMFYMVEDFISTF